MLCLLLSAFFSGSESAIFSSDEAKLKSAYSGSKKVQRVLGLKKNPDCFLSSILFGNTLVNITFSSVVAIIVYSWFPQSKGVAELITTAVGTLLIPVSYTHLDVYKRQPVAFISPSSDR